MSQDAIGKYLSSIGQWELLTSEEEKRCGVAFQKYLKLKKEFIDSLEFKNKENNEVYIQEKNLYYLNERCSFTLWKKNIKENIFSLWSKRQGIEIEELFSIFWEGIKSKKRLYTGNLRLVISIAKKYIKHGIEFDDAIQEGNRGLNSAVEKFNPEYGFRFSTYAYWWIKQMITRSICDTARSVRLPVHVTDTKSKILRESREFFVREGRYPTSDEVEEKLRLSNGKVREVFDTCLSIIPLDSTVGKEKEVTLLDIVSVWKPEYNELEDGVLSSLVSLSIKQRKVLIIRYGLSDGYPKSLAEAGKIMGFNKAVVRQVERAAFNKLSRVPGLKDCLG